MMISMQICAVLNTTCMGISEAACVLVGNQIGANNVPMAHRLAKMTMFQAISVALMISTLLCVYKELFVGLFTDEDGIDVTIAMNCLGIFFYTNLVDMTLNFFMGCVRALGI